MAKWININQEVIIDYHVTSRIAIFCGCTEDEYKTPMFDCQGYEYARYVYLEVDNFQKVLDFRKENYIDFGY